MIYIKNDVVNLTVGDDAVLTISLKTDEGEPYEMAAHEFLIFSVREKASLESPLLLEIVSDLMSNDIVFTHDDTKDMEPGFYSAEVQLMTDDGKRITVWPLLEGNARTSATNRKNFCLMTEVVGV